jgi:hypothetical protein
MAAIFAYPPAAPEDESQKRLVDIEINNQRFAAFGKFVKSIDVICLNSKTKPQR